MKKPKGAVTVTIKTCPVCRLENEEVELAVHLMSSHEWKYERAMDWIRAIEEAKPCES